MRVSVPSNLNAPKLTTFKIPLEQASVSSPNRKIYWNPSSGKKAAGMNPERATTCPPPPPPPPRLLSPTAPSLRSWPVVKWNEAGGKPVWPGAGPLVSDWKIDMVIQSWSVSRPVQKAGAFSSNIDFRFFFLFFSFLLFFLKFLSQRIHRTMESFTISCSKQWIDKTNFILLSSLSLSLSLCLWQHFTFSATFYIQCCIIT